MSLFLLYVMVGVFFAVRKADPRKSLLCRMLDAFPIVLVWPLLNTISIYNRLIERGVEQVEPEVFRRFLLDREKPLQKKVEEHTPDKVVFIWVNESGIVRGRVTHEFPKNLNGSYHYIYEVLE